MSSNGSPGATGTGTASASNSPAKQQQTQTSSLKSRIAAFESGAAANASRSSPQKAIPHADLGNLRSRFDREGEKPLVVKGSFGLGAPPPGSGSGSGTGIDNAGSSGSGSNTRSVSLGSGRAASPMTSPTVVVGGVAASTLGLGRSSTTTSTAATRASSIASASASSSSRPVSMRSDSTASSIGSSIATSTNTAVSGSTASSLLPGPLAALTVPSSAGRSGSSTSSVAGDDVSGLRTPMSSISLSSMLVETGSNAGDGAPSSVLSGDDTPNEDGTKPDKIRDSGASTPAGQSGAASVADAVLLADASTAEAAADASEARSAPGEVQVEPTRDAVKRAAKTLEEYREEEPSASAAQSATTTVAPVQAEAISEHLPESAGISPAHIATSGRGGDNTADPADSSLSPSHSPSKRRSRPTISPSSSAKGRLSRTLSTASHPESDLADASNLVDASSSGQDAAAAAVAGERVAESMAPPPAPSTGEEASDAPVQDIGDSGPVAPVVDASAEPQPRREPDVDMDMDVPMGADEETDDLDEDGMPKVKCSDFGRKVGVMQLGEHICAPTSATAAGAGAGAGAGAKLRPERTDTPEDVPVDHSPFSSPVPQHREVPGLSPDRREKPDVPDDASVSSLDPAADHPSLSLSHPDNDIPDVPVSAAARGSGAGAQAAVVPDAGAASAVMVPSPSLENDNEAEEDYMTARTSHTHRDSMDQDQQNGLRPAFAAAARANASAAIDDEEDETEELALGMAGSPDDRPLRGAFAYPDSPTPDREHLAPAASSTATGPQEATPTAKRTAPGLSVGASDSQPVMSVRRRSTGRNRNLGDTDSEGDNEPGTATIIR